MNSKPTTTANASARKKTPVVLSAKMKNKGCSKNDNNDGEEYVHDPANDYKCYTYSSTKYGKCTEVEYFHGIELLI